MAGGELTLYTCLRYATVHSTHANLKTGRCAALKVSDTGSGMPPEIADRALEPFLSTKPKGEGSGLGLATIYGIVTQAGGNVRIYSEPQLSTTITVLLPVTDQPPPPDEHAPGKPERGDGELVLLVEDEPAMREVTRRILVRNGYQVISTASGHEAVNAAATSPEPITLLVTDVIMPGMQGREVAERVSRI
jgi:hypothetical protein